MDSKFERTMGTKSGPSYSFVLNWEENFDQRAALDLLRDNWHIPYILAVLVYLPVLYFGQKLMNNREPFKLKIPLMIWNSTLALFSTIGFLRVLPEFIYSLSEHGFQHSICNNSYIYVKPARYWIYLFVLSKTPELVDTIFLVLKKQKLIFLHVYHHATVLMFSWFVWTNSLACARWFCTINYGIHSVMYTYYALKAFPHLIKIPKWISMIITASQTIQMIVGAYVVMASSYAKFKGQQCATSMTMSVFGLIIYISYLFLFSKFFYKAYFAKPTAVAKDDKKRA